MIDKLFPHTVVTRHHEKLFTKPSRLFYVINCYPSSTFIYSKLKSLFEKQDIYEISVNVFYFDILFGWKIYYFVFQLGFIFQKVWIKYEIFFVCYRHGDDY